MPPAGLLETKRGFALNVGWPAGCWPSSGAGSLGVIGRLNHVRAIGIDPARGHRVHQGRLAQLAREAGRTTVQHIAAYAPFRP